MSSRESTLPETKTSARARKSEFYQAHLDRVSRSFALGIRQLDEPARALIGLSYLLFRLLDTIEDSAWPNKRAQLKSFAAFESFIERSADADEIRAWAKNFDPHIPDGELRLLKDAHLLLADFHALSSELAKIVRDGVLNMSRGMRHFVEATPEGQRIKLKDSRETDQYCFFVAGVVGELLTKVAQAENSFSVGDRLLGDAFHFGMFLQKVNLLKDQREDANQDRFLVTDREGLRLSVDAHARRALRYLQSLPVEARPYRLFCAWALYLGLASLPWIDRAWLDGSSAKMPRTKALPLLERLTRIIDDNASLASEAEKYLGHANVLNFDPSLRQDLVVEPWFTDAYRGELTKAELAGLGVLKRFEQPAPDRDLEVGAAVDLAEQALIAKQRKDGAWVGEVELNPGPTAQVVMLHAALGRELPAELKNKALAYIQRTQQDDGGWSPHGGAASEVSLSAECYAALRFLGIPHEDERMLSAARFIRGPGGGLASANAWTQLYLSILGVLPWKAIHHTPIEIMLLPEKSPLHVGNLSYWVKAIVIPMALLGEVGPGDAHPMGREIAIELGVERKQFAPNEKSLLLQAVSTLGGALRDLRGVKFLRGIAVARAWKWIDKLTEASGDFGGNTCTAINVLLAMHRSGREKDPQFAAGFERLMKYAVERQDEWHMQCCQSHVWDTSLALKAMRIDSADSRIARAKAKDWLLERQIRTVKGQWTDVVKAEPAAWCFGDHHDLFPVTDCTAVALLALDKQIARRGAEIAPAALAVDWLLAMQHQGGGWSAYEKHVGGGWLNKFAKFKDIENALVDMPKADVSSKVMEALASHRAHPGVDEALARARIYLLSERDERGLWRGNYGVNYLYGTSFACAALRAVDGGVREQWALRAREFFMQTQNEDGGWGESDVSYTDKSLAGRGAAHSSPVQTAWALIGLCNCFGETATEVARIHRAIDFLVDSQLENGEWVEAMHQGTVFPGKVYFKYELYPLYFPLAALNQARALLKDQK